jgi:ribosomal protein S18 acetylase RimI-like enzyme
VRACTIRPMTPEDIPAVTKWMVTVPLWQRYQLSASDVSAQFAQALKQDHILLVADRAPDDRCCGFVWCLPCGAFGRSAYIRLLGVQAEHTGTGIGTVLLTRAERTAAEASSDMFLLVSDFNLAAQRFYRRHSYQQVGAIPGYVLPDVTELIFWKRLHEICQSM